MEKKLPRTAWKKGQPSPNPKGAPQKDESISFLMRKFLQSSPPGEEKSYKQMFVEKVYLKAIKEGDASAIKLIWNYIDGMPKQTSDITSNGQTIAGVQVYLPQKDNV